MTTLLQCFFLPPPIFFLNLLIFCILHTVSLIQALFRFRLFPDFVTLLLHLMAQKGYQSGKIRYRQLRFSDMDMTNMKRNTNQQKIIRNAGH